jgi:hypothetical protein
VTGLTPEVLDALVRLMRGEVDYDSLDDDALYALGAACAAARETLYQVVTRLNDRGATFATIGERLDVHEATASRWAKPPAEDRRRRRGEA